MHNGSGPANHAPASSAGGTSVAATTSYVPARGYNQLFFEGRLVEDPALRQAGTGRFYCRVTVLQDQSDRNGQPGVQAVDVVCFDERAARFAERFRRGDYAIFVGRMSLERRRPERAVLHEREPAPRAGLGHRPARHQA